MMMSSFCERVAHCGIPIRFLFATLCAGFFGCADDAEMTPVDEPLGLSTVVNDQYLSTLQSLIEGARRSVAMVHFELNEDADGDAIVGFLATAAARGVVVQVLLEDSVSDNPKRIPALTAAQVTARLDLDARYTHAKLVVADGERALLGSTNLSAQSMRRNNEANLLIANAEIAGWFHGYAQKLMAQPAATPELVPTETALGVPLSDGDYVGRAGALIDGAQRRIALVVYGMNADPKYPASDVNDLIGRLSAAARRGVSVRVLLETARRDLGVNEVNRQAAQALRAAGIETRFDSPDEITHAKLLLVDDVAIVGSNNWGYGGFRTYHEVGMMTRVPSVVDKLTQYFDGLWSSAAAQDLR
jgi:phosphatidylserine/phosphatidylglycerophosphate/cardiolipin synthase-like enzyme